MHLHYYKAIQNECTAMMIKEMMNNFVCNISKVINHHAYRIAFTD